MKHFTISIACVLFSGLSATRAQSQQLDFRYMVESGKNLVLCRVHNASDEELRIAPCGDDENCPWITKGSRSWSLPSIVRRWGGHPPRSFYHYIQPGETTSLLWSGWPSRWRLHDEGLNFRAVLKWRIWDKWDSQYDVESEGIPFLFISPGDTSGMVDVSPTMLSFVCLENKCRKDVFAVPNVVFSVAKESARKNPRPCFLLRSPALDMVEMVSFQESFRIDNADVAPLEDIAFVSWKAVLNSVDEDRRAMLVDGGDVDLTWVCGGVESECLRLWVKPDDPPPPPETAADYEYDEEELARFLDRLGITPEGKEELRKNGGLNQLTLWLIQDGDLPAKKKEARNDGESPKVESTSDDK